MLMIWALLLMSMVVMGTVEHLRFSMDQAVFANAEFRALHLAESGLAVALHPNARRGDKVLKQRITADSGFDVVINYEGARLPVNLLGDERLRQAVEDLFIRWGLNAQEAAIAADSLADWIDSDNKPRANGAEREYYEQLGLSKLPAIPALAAPRKWPWFAAWEPWRKSNRNGRNFSVFMAMAPLICEPHSRRP